MRAREYSGPLGILAAGAIGISLLCSVSAMAMGDINRYISLTLVPINLVDLAVANFSTAAAFTEQMVTDFVPTETLVGTSTLEAASLTPQPTDTQRRFVTITPTLTRRVRATLSAVVVVPASRTPTRPPTRTPTLIPTRTRTPTLQPTVTPIPATFTPVPTDIVVPPTPTEPPTATEPPIPTEPPTATEPPVTDVPTSIDPGAGAPPTETPGP